MMGIHSHWREEWGAGASGGGRGARKESRGAHDRSDYPAQNEAFENATLISYDEGRYSVRLDEGKQYES